MTPESSSDNAAPRMSEASRIPGVLFDPKKAFADIAAWPTWIVPVILSAIVGVLFIYMFTTKVGWLRYFTQLAEISKKMQQMDAATRENTINMQVKFGAIFGYVFGVIGPVLMALITGGVVLLMCKMTDVALTFKQLFAMSAWASLPRVVAGVLAIVVMTMNPENFNLQNPLAFNLGHYMEPPPNSGTFLYSIATSIDLFTIWSILLLAIGISAAARKVSLGKAVMLVATPWIVWVLVSSGFGAMFS